MITTERKTFGVLGRKKPSEFLRQSIEEFKWFRNREECHANMLVYLSPHIIGCNLKCSGCLGAAHLYRKYGPIDGTVTQAKIDALTRKHTARDEKRKYALDRLRLGLVYQGLRWLGMRRIPDRLPARIKVIDYHKNSRAWFAGMRKLIRLFEENGL